MLNPYKNYHIIIQETTQNVEKPNFEPFFFNTPAYILNQACSKLYTLQLYKNNKVEAICHLCIDNTIAYSPLKAPFGGIEFSNNLPIDVLVFFIQHIETFCKQQKIEKLHIKVYPFSYHPSHAQILTQLLIQEKYHIESSELCHFLPISSHNFEENLHHSEKRRLKKCLANNFEVKIWENPDLNFTYEFIKTCRFRKNYPITLELENFKKLFQKFPDKYKIFIAQTPDQEIIALTVVVVINSKILYNFYPADHPDYQHFSPTVLLVKALYQYCQQEKFELLDLGISTDKGVPNVGLIQFKTHLGVQSCLKFSFSKNFE